MSQNKFLPPISRIILLIWIPIILSRLTGICVIYYPPLPDFYRRHIWANISSLFISQQSLSFLLTWLRSLATFVAGFFVNCSTVKILRIFVLCPPKRSLYKTGENISTQPHRFIMHASLSHLIIIGLYRNLTKQDPIIQVHQALLSWNISQVFFLDISQQLPFVKN